MKKFIYSILTLGFLVSCSSGGSDSPEPLSEQLIIGTWELLSSTTDLQIYTIDNDIKTVLLDSTFYFDKNDWIEENGTLPVWRFDSDGKVYDSQNDMGFYELNGSNYRLEDSTGVYTGEFSIDSERLIFYNFGGEYLEYDTINNWWESQFIDVTFEKIENNQKTQKISNSVNLKDFISNSILKK